VYFTTFFTVFSFTIQIHAAPNVKHDFRLQEMPLAFEQNIGQYGPDVQFVARSAGATLSLNKRRATLLVHGVKRGITITPVRITHSVQVEGLDETEGKSNYFLGDDPRKWVTNVARYSRVRYRNVYPGIDLIFHGNQQNIEYDFVISPGADPNRIELKFAGADFLRLDRTGDLILAAAGGLSLTQRLPQLYQEENGARKMVEGSYVIRGKNRVGFRVGPYIPSRTLVIDPVVGYSARFTGVSGSYPFAIAADASGNAYVTGNTSKADLPILPGSFEVGNTTQNVLFVYKLNSTGTDFVYTTLIGGSGGQYGTGIAVDAQGNAYVTGVTASTDFPVTSGAFQTTLPSAYAHGFILKLNAAGNALVYCTFVGGNYTDMPAAIAIDASGNAYITGSTESTTFPVTPGAFQSSLAPGTMNYLDAFVTKLNSTGTALVYSTYLGGQFDDVGNGIAVDSDGNAYIAGSTDSSDFPLTYGAFETSGGGNIGFVTKMNPTGSSLVYSSFLDAANGSFASGVAVDSTGSAYVVGTGSASRMGTPVNYGTGFGGLFVAKLNPAGSALSYLTSLGGSGTQQSTGMALDSSGNVYVSGSTDSIDFPLLSPVQTAGPSAESGSPVGLVFKLNPSGSLAYSTYFGSDYDKPNAIAVDPNSNAYITGTATSIVFPVTPGAINVDTAPSGPSDGVFVAKLSSTDVCNFTFSPASAQEPAAGATDSISVTTAGGCDWISMAGQNWTFPSQPGVRPLDMPSITLTSPTAGSGSGTVTFSVPPNNNPARAQILSIAGTSIPVTQADGCTYQLSKSSLSVLASGGLITNAFDVTTGFYCSFTISNPAAWVFGTAGTFNGSGSGQIDLQISANTTGAPRSVILTIAGQPFVINQSGGYALCNYSLSPATSTINYLGLSGTFNVTTGSGCSWTLSSDSAWLQITRVSSSYSSNSTVGTGNGTVYYTALENTSSNKRSGVITIGGQTFTVTQGGLGVLSSGPVTPNLGSGSSQTFTLEYSDTAGAASLEQVWAYFNATLANPASNACVFYYNAPTNQINLLSDNALVWTPAVLGSAATLQNSQCSLNVASAKVSLSGNVVTLTIPVAFKPAFAGTKNIYLHALDGSGINSGWQQLGTWIVGGSAGTASAISVTPPSGSAPSQTFALEYSDTAGAGSFEQVWAYFNSTLANPATNACLLYYNVATSQLNLLGDNGATWQAATLGAAVTLQNSQCSVSAATATVVPSGNTLTLHLPMTFKPPYAGVKNVYLRAVDVSGTGSTWQQFGSWTVTVTSGTPAAVSVTPSSEPLVNQTFTLQYSDTAGAGNLEQVWVYFNVTLANPASDACILYYSPASNQLNLLGDNGTTWESATLGTATTLQNSQCVVSAANTTVTLNGNMLTLNLPMIFEPAYQGTKNIYLRALDVSGANSGWQQLGNCTVTTTANVALTVSATPSSGSGTSQTFTLQYYDSSGAASLTQAWVYFSATLANPASHACLLYYNLSIRQISLLNDNGTTWQAATLGAPVTLQNSQCSLNAATATVALTGSILTWNVTMTFTPAYAGAQNVYLRGLDEAGLSGIWQQYATWTVPAP
jgi:hypothetical protein